MSVLSPGVLMSSPIDTHVTVASDATSSRSASVTARFPIQEHAERQTKWLVLVQHELPRHLTPLRKVFTAGLIGILSVAVGTTAMAASSTASPTASVTASTTAAQQATTPLTASAKSSLVLILRHATAPGVGDPAQFQLHDCTTQRNLNQAGQEQSRRIALSLADIGFVPKQIWSSQWCRAMETAQIMANTRPPVEVIELALLNSTFRDRGDAQTQNEALRQFIKDLNPSEGPYLMISHQVNITDLVSIYPPSGHGAWLRLTGDPTRPWEIFPADTDNLEFPALGNKQQ